MNKWFSLEGTHCVVAGADGLLGRACVRALSDSGAEVIGLDVQGKTTQVDITDEKALVAFFNGLFKVGSSKGWAFVNCAYPHTANWGKLGFENFTAEDWSKNVELQLGSTFIFAQQAVKFMKGAGGGTLINFGSIYGLQGPDLRIYEGTPMKNPAAYAAVKAGTIGLTRYIATAFGADGIRANVVCPGGIEDRQPESFKKNYIQRTPLGRMGTPEDVGGVVAFLAGPSAKYITGQVIAVDGGWTAW